MYHIFERSEGLHDGPVLPGKHVEAGAEFHGHGLDDGEILDGKLSEHGDNLVGRGSLISIRVVHDGSPSWTTRFNFPKLTRKNISLRYLLWFSISLLLDGKSNLFGVGF